MANVIILLRIKSPKLFTICMENELSVRNLKIRARKKARSSVYMRDEIAISQTIEPNVTIRLFDHPLPFNALGGEGVIPLEAWTIFVIFGG